ncbi:MAG: NUDIX hydrolase [Gammaproteobacteria bacterium]
MPDARMAPDYYVWEMRDWANVVALTAQRELILVRQYRHAAGCHFREFPGGVIEHTHDADAAAAAARELREETGYAPGSLVALGCHYPNPALQDNRLHVFLALDCVQVGAPTPDAGEDLVTELVDLADYLADNNGDAPRHGLMLASWALALPRLREHFPDIAAPA